MTKEELENEKEALSKRIEDLTDELENLQDEYDEYDELEDAQESAIISDYTDVELIKELKSRSGNTITIVVQTMKQREDLLTFVNNFIWPHFNDQQNHIF